MCGVLLAFSELLSTFARRPRITHTGHRRRVKIGSRDSQARALLWPLTAGTVPDDDERQPTAAYELGSPFEVDVPASPADATSSNELTSPGYELPKEWQEDYREQSELAHGGKGHVSIIQHTKTSKLFVVKTIRACRTSNGTHELPGEVKALAWHLREHNNIVSLQGYELRLTVRKTMVCDLLLEYCAGGDLHGFCDHWRSMRRYVPPIMILHFIASMSDALAFLHLGRGSLIEGNAVRSYDQDPRAYPVLHQDIKPENIFLRWPPLHNTYGLPDIVLGDLGYACPAQESTGIYGTPGYYPPEAKDVWALEDTRPTLFDLRLKAKIMTEASDIYTFGATLYVLMTNRQFDNRDFDHVPPSLEKDVARSEVGHTPSMLQMLMECLAREPSERCTTEDLWASAPGMKRAVKELYEQGQRLPDDAFDYLTTASFDDGRLTSDASSAYEEMVEYVPVRHAQAAPARDDTSGRGIENAIDSVQNLSGFTDEFCWCANHRSISLRLPGPGCVDRNRAEPPSTTGAEALARGDSIMEVKSRGATARARSYQAEIPQYSEENKA